MIAQVGMEVGVGTLVLAGFVMLLLGSLNANVPVIGKKPKVNQMIGVIFIGVAVFAWVGIFSGEAPDFKLQSMAEQTQVLTGNLVSEAYASCMGQANTVLPVLMKDPDSATPTAALSASSSAYAKNLKTGQLYSTSAWTVSGESNLNLSRVCGKPDEYELDIVTKRGEYASATIRGIYAKAAQLDTLSIPVNQLTYAQIRVEDTDQPTSTAAMYCFVDSTGTGTNTTAVVDLNSTTCYDDAAATATSKAADSQINYDVYIQAATARKWMNEKGRPYYACVDINNGTATEQWDATQLVVSMNGVTLPDMKPDMNLNDRDYTKVKKSAGCYEIGDVTNTQKKFHVNLKTLAETDPTSTNGNIAIHFLAEGSYLSSKNSGVVYRGVVTDATTKVSVCELAGYVQDLVISVS